MAALSFAESIRSKYPSILSHGIEISDIQIGWEKLIKEMLNEIMLQPDHASIKITHIKQKFASLRVHYDGYVSESIKQIIEKTVTRADSTCEFCECQTTRIASVNFWQRMCCVRCEKEKTPLDTPYGD